MSREQKGVIDLAQKEGLRLGTTKNKNKAVLKNSLCLVEIPFETLHRCGSISSKI